MSGVAVEHLQYTVVESYRVTLYTVESRIISVLYLPSSFVAITYTASFTRDGFNDATCSMLVIGQPGFSCMKLLRISAFTATTWD